ncbi:MAG: hypothetical protein II349_04450 [Akkermansia sp.]|nr:hypothetical protein [Akkermansia sp.]
MLRNFLIALGISSAICATIFIPDWGEDPQQLAIGEWKEASPRGMMAEVSDTTIQWQGYGRHGKLTYEWVQTENEPYRVRIKKGQNLIEANVTFNGKDEATLEPEIFDKLPDIARSYIRDLNKRNNRPETEIVLVFRRVEAKESD